MEGPSKDRIFHMPAMDMEIFQRPFMDGRTLQCPTFGKMSEIFSISGRQLRGLLGIETFRKMSG